MTSGRHRGSTAAKSRGDIQGLRALAVLLVVFGHAGLLALTGGYIGVDVFFVISGFLITSLLLREATGTGRLSLAGFYARRAKRILPAATATLVATAIAATALLPYVQAQSALHDIAWAAIFAVNIHFGQARTDYFATNLPPSPIQHFWSLSVEEQFYLVWPTLMIVVLIVGARRSSAAVERRLPRLALLVAVLCGLSLAWSVYATRTQPNAANSPR